MRYRIPIEAPRGRFAKYAVRASAPYWACLIGGALPALVWSAANAWFLGCRDARRQTLFAIVAYLCIIAIGGSRMWLYTSGTFADLLGNEGKLANSIMFSVHFLAGLGALRFLAGRQLDVAAYRNSLGKKLPWGLWLIGAFLLVNLFVFPLILETAPQLFWLWGPMLVLR
jgi:hypothetical protein